MDGLVGVVEDWLGDCEAADDCKQLYECLQSDLDRLTHAIYTLCDERSRYTKALCFLVDRILFDQKVNLHQLVKARGYCLIHAAQGVECFHCLLVAAIWGRMLVSQSFLGENIPIWKRSLTYFTVSHGGLKIVVYVLYKHKLFQNVCSVQRMVRQHHGYIHHTLFLVWMLFWEKFNTFIVHFKEYMVLHWQSQCSGIQNSESHYHHVIETETA